MGHRGDFGVGDKKKEACFKLKEFTFLNKCNLCDPNLCETLWDLNIQILIFLSKVTKKGKQFFFSLILAENQNSQSAAETDPKEECHNQHI